VAGGDALPRSAPPWLERDPPRSHESLAGQFRADIAIVGSGITGLTLARLLSEAGLSVALVEADRVGLGVSCFTTAKVTALQGTTYSRLRAKHGPAAASVYARANTDAFAWIAGRAGSQGAEEGFRRRTAFTYAAGEDQREAVESEAQAAREAGLDVELLDEAPLPYPSFGAVALPEQAEMDPHAYLQGLARSLDPEAVRIFEGSRVTSVSDGSPCRVRTAAGEVVCEQVVLATLTPILDRSLAFARTHAERSYCVALEASADLAQGMHISAAPPIRSVRSHRRPDGEVLIVGGEGHKVGQAGSHRERYLTLERFAGEHFEVGEPLARWSAQDWLSADGAPLIGPVNPLTSRIHMATGYGKWGLTTGTAAALALADVLSGGDSDFVDAFGSNRLKPLASASSLLKQNADAGFHFFADRLRERGSRKSGELEPWEAGIVQHEGRRSAAFRDGDGRLHAVSATCTHLHCQVRWNDAERSWDCPCHGSRFGVDGAVLQGPATKPLERLT
jgi:glycine/D-amino acid oxidase-like deaminating enzyme/nitrite reductase/ring-hydroxylating ferredoxin subunit